MSEARFLDIHILHPVPFSNLNRDNLGTPKQVTYGNTVRSRISSQCAKRAARLWLETNTDLDSAVRTRRLPELARAALLDRGHGDTNAVAAVKTVFSSLGITTKGGSNENDPLQGDQLTFTTVDAAERIADIASEHMPEVLELAESLGLTSAVPGDSDEDADGELAESPTAKTKDFPKKERKKSPWSDVAAVFDRHNSVIALCGRMLADLPETNVDGALQVAHSFTTHEGVVEPDYFTAVDDENPAEETGAGHINVNEFTSGVFYRHATVDIGSLRSSLSSGQCADESVPSAAVVAAFVRAFTVAEPSGKQNSANAHTRPALVAVAVRSDRPVSYAAAFEAPVRSGRHGGYAAASVSQLNAHVAADNDLYGTDGLEAAWHAVRSDISDGSLAALGERVRSLDDLTAAIEAHLRSTP